MTRIYKAGLRVRLPMSPNRWRSEIHRDRAFHRRLFAAHVEASRARGRGYEDADCD